MCWENEMTRPCVTRRSFLTQSSALACCLGLGSKATDAGEPPSDGHVLEVARSWHIDHPTHHVQGLAVQVDWFWFTCVQREANLGWVYRVDRQTLKVVAQRRLVDAAQFHPGGIQLVGRALWVPLAEYQPRSTSTILRLDAVTLMTTASFTVDDHIGALAFNDKNRLYAANWDSRQIYTFDTDGKPLDVIDNPTDVRLQDMEYHDGLLLGIGRTEVNRTSMGTVVALDPESREVVDRWLLTGTTRGGDANFGREGFSVWQDSFFAMPEDGPDTTVYEFLRKQP
jgi:hypothetical protein